MGADHNLACAGEDLPDDDADRIAGRIRARIDALSFGDAGRVVEVIAGGDAPDDMNVLERAGRGQDAQHADLSDREGDAGEAKGVAHLDAPHDMLCRGPAEGDDLLVKTAERAPRLDEGSRFDPRPRDLDEGQEPESGDR